MSPGNTTICGLYGASIRAILKLIGPWEENRIPNSTQCLPFLMESDWRLLERNEPRQDSSSLTLCSPTLPRVVFLVVLEDTTSRNRQANYIQKSSPARSISSIVTK